MPALVTKFAHNLKRLRLARKLSQKDLANRCGLSVSYISMLEREQRSPPLETLEIVAKQLHTTATAMIA